VSVLATMISVVTFLALVALTHAGAYKSSYDTGSDSINWSILAESDLFKIKSVSTECWQAMDACSAKTLTTGRCKSTASSVALNNFRNDVDVNCKVNAEDFIPDIKFYDANNDGQTCRDEWIDRRVNYLGYTREFANSEWDILMGTQGPACLETEAVKSFPTLDLETDFTDVNIDRLVTFCLQGNNMAVNRDCLGLPVICRDIRPDLSACQKLPDRLNTRSLKQKLDLNQRMNDPDGDGISTEQEVMEDISDFFDLDNDGCATVEEWIVRWTQFYGFSEENARGFYTDDNNCLDVTNVRAFVGAGVPSATFPNLIISVIVAMCEATPSLYETNTDCAMVVDTCRVFYPDNDACNIYVDECGLPKYRECVQLLPLAGSCRGAKDRAEVHLERHRVDNTLLPGADCKDYQESCRQYNEGKERFMELFRMS